jgi:L-phenylalanine/L-methionine N-acetyltransferase
LPIENLKIRRAEPDDYLAVHEMFSSPDVYEGTMQLPYPSRDLWRKRVAEAPENFFNLVAVVDERVVGMLGIETFPNRPRRRHVGRIGISVAAEWQGKGVGTALMAAVVDLADNWLNLTRLELEVYADNAAAIRLYERFGFIYEGTLRQHAFRNGEYVDSNVMGRLRPAKE